MMAEQNEVPSFELVTQAEARRALRCGKATLNRLHQEGKLEFVKLTERGAHVTKRSLAKLVNDLAKEAERRT